MRLKILYIEDQPDKYNSISGLLKKNKHSKLLWAKNYTEGLLALDKGEFDFLLLDMSLPISALEQRKNNYDSFAGMSILKEIKRRKKNIKVILVTGFNDFEREGKITTLTELESQIQQKYSDYYIGTVRYDSTTIEWQDSLLRSIEGSNSNEGIGS